MTRPTCETCPFWGAEPAGDFGLCRINPPRLQTKPLIEKNLEGHGIGMEEHGAWPLTFGEADWCGKHPDFRVWAESTSSQSPSDIPPPSASARS